jgi:hypothetical protein
LKAVWFEDGRLEVLVVKGELVTKELRALRKGRFAAFFGFEFSRGVGELGEIGLRYVYRFYCRINHSSTVNPSSANGSVISTGKYRRSMVSGWTYVIV